MLDFYFIADEQPKTTASSQLKYAGSMESEEVELAQQVGIIERQADYYGKFRWSSEQVLNKLLLLASCPMRARTALHAILGQAKAAGVGLLVLGD